MAKPKKSESKPKEIHIRLPIFISDGQDGSVSVTVFKTTQDAERAADHEDQRFDDDVHLIEITVDENGNLIDGFENIDEYLAEHGVDEDEEDGEHTHDNEDLEFEDDEEIVDED